MSAWMHENLAIKPDQRFGYQPVRGHLHAPFTDQNLLDKALVRAAQV